MSPPSRVAACLVPPARMSVSVAPVRRARSRPAARGDPPGTQSSASRCGRLRRPACQSAAGQRDPCLLQPSAAGTAATARHARSAPPGRLQDRGRRPGPLSGACHGLGRSDWPGQVRRAAVPSRPASACWRRLLAQPEAELSGHW